MAGPVEAPQWDDLVGLPIDVAEGDEPWVRSVTAWAGDGDGVTMTWDEVAGSAHVRWVSKTGDRLVVERECLWKVSVRDIGDHVEFHAWFRSGDLGGRLAVEIGAHVVVTDTLLRQ